MQPLVASANSGTVEPWWQRRRSFEVGSMSGLRNPHRNAIDRVVVAYLVALLVGTGLLMLPTATSTPGGISLRSALFTATSALSVTGLEVLETGSDVTVVGLAVLLGRKSAGGRGVRAHTSLLAVGVAGKAGLRVGVSAAAEAKSSDTGGVSPMVLRIFGLTVATEAIVATAL